MEGYGLSEASPVVACNPPDGRVKDGSVGVPVLGTRIEIRDPVDPSRILGPHEKGEVCVRGPQVMLGYWGGRRTRKAVFVDGALRTGDIGYLDEDGYLFLVDRIKDVILCGGYNVYPRVLEEALYQHPAVAEAVVVGVPDAYRGQAPQGVRHAARRASSATAGRTARISRPGMSRRSSCRARWKSGRALPKTMVGKLSKKELLEEELSRPPNGAR